MRPLLLAPLALAALLPQGAGRAAVFPNGTVEARGACEARPESVACWDMDGKPSPELAEGLRAALSNNGEVSFRLGKKNRYLVVRRPQGLQPQYRMGRETHLSANATYNTDPVVDYIRLAAEPDATVATVSVSTSVQSPKDEDVPLRVGATAQIEGQRLEIGEAVKVAPDKNRPATNPYSGQRVVGEVWNVVIGLTPEVPQSNGWAFTPLDKEGQPIRYVDAVGKPISALKALALEPNIQPGYGYYYNNGTPPPAKPKASAAYFQGGGGSTFRAATNIDPKAIATLRIRASHTETKELGPFPLDAAK